MKKWPILSSVSTVVLAAAFSANAQTTLTEILFNKDGTVSDQYPNTSTPITGVSVTSGFGSSGVPNYLTGLGTLQYTVSGAGLHNFDAFVDDEADYSNGPFNDSGAALGLPFLPSYMSWEIGNPETGGAGSIGDNAASDTLDNFNDINPVPLRGVDVALALGFDFSLSAGQTATIDLTLSSTAPSSGFYLAQHSVAQPQDTLYTENWLYYSGSLDISSPGTPTAPDNGSTLVLMVVGVAGLASMTRFERKFSKVKVD